MKSYSQQLYKESFLLLKKPILSLFCCFLPFILFSGCSKKSAIPTVKPIANFNYTVIKSGVYLPYTVNFKDSSNNNPANYSWDFGDGNFSTSSNPSNSYTDNGTYKVKLIVTNAGGADTITRSITITGTKISTVKYTNVALAQPIVISNKGGSFVIPELSKTDTIRFSFLNISGVDAFTQSAVSVVFIMLNSQNIAFSCNKGPWQSSRYGVVTLTTNPLQYANGDSLLGSSAFDADNINQKKLLVVHRDASCASCLYTGTYDPTDAIESAPIFNSLFKENDEGYLMFRFQNSDKSYTYGWILINTDHSRVLIKGYAFQGTNPLKAGR